MLTGDNGIITQAIDSREESQIAEEKEQIGLAWSGAKIVTGGDTVTAEDLKEQFTTNGIAATAKDNSDNTITISFVKNVYKIDSNGNITGPTEDEGSSSLEGVEVYAKLYSYDDGSGCLLELSSKADTVSSETGVTLQQDYGNIGTTAYKYKMIYEEYEENGIDVSYTSDKDSIVPPWLTLQTMEEVREDEGHKFITEIHMDMNNIIKVNIVDEIKPKNTVAWFYGCMSLREIKGIENLDTSEVTDMSGMFMHCMNLTNLDVSGFNTEKVTNMKDMFFCCEKLTGLNVSGFDTKNVIDMANMFRQCTSLTTLDVSGFETENVTDMCYMFTNCRAVITLDLSNFNTEKVTDMTHMFSMCSSLTTIYINEDIWKTAPIATDMLGGCGTSTLTPKETSST